MDNGIARIAPGAIWPGIDPREIAEAAVTLGVHHVILLDLSRVGTDRGVGTERLLTGLRAQFPSIDITVGGGIRGVEDVLAIKQLGASAVLVGSAIHDGRIGRPDLDRIGRET